MYIFARRSALPFWLAAIHHAGAVHSAADRRRSGALPSQDSLTCSGQWVNITALGLEELPAQPVQADKIAAGADRVGVYRRDHAAAKGVSQNCIMRRWRWSTDRSPSRNG